MELKINQAAIVLGVGDGGSINVNVNAGNMDCLEAKLCKLAYVRSGNPKILLFCDYSRDVKGNTETRDMLTFEHDNYQFIRYIYLYLVLARCPLILVLGYTHNANAF